MKGLLFLLLCLVSVAANAQLIDLFEDFSGTPGGNITYFGSSSAPADNATSGVSPRSVVPPASMVVGDLVYIHSMVSATDRTHAISDTGGQTWNTPGPGLNNVFQIFWCRFNGTWSSNPSVAISGASQAKSVVMHVFRPTDTAKSWAVDQGPTYNLSPSGSTHTITGVTNIHTSTVTITSWTFGSSSAIYATGAGIGWNFAGNAQYRNTSTSGNCTAFSYKTMVFSGATGNVSRNMTGVSPATNRTSIISFYEF